MKHKTRISREHGVQTPETLTSVCIHELGWGGGGGEGGREGGGMDILWHNTLLIPLVAVDKITYHQLLFLPHHVRACHKY